MGHSPRSKEILPIVPLMQQQGAVEEVANFLFRPRSAVAGQRHPAYHPVPDIA
jgi:hypothetical protein